MAISKRQPKAFKALNYDLFSHPALTPPAPVTLYAKIAAQAVPLAMKASLEAMQSTDSRLPTVEGLLQLFEEFNWRYFEGRLPVTRIEWSSRMRCAGSYCIRERLIRMGQKYHEIFPEEVIDTLKHEMIHIIHHNHDRAFKKEAARVGASLRARSHPSLRKPPKFVYVCPKCGIEYARQKRLVMASCGKCSRGGFDIRCKLSLKKGAIISREPVHQH